MQRIRYFLLVSLALCFANAGADTLLVDAVASDVTQQGPARGLTMDQVLAQYGEPARRLGPVGEPPISHWDYNNVVVYFEHQYVIHSVVPHDR